MALSVHPTAVVDAGAVLGDGCRVWHFVHISAGARIGRDCSFGQGVYVGDDVLIGDRVKVQNVNRLGTDIAKPLPADASQAQSTDAKPEADHGSR